MSERNHERFNQAVAAHMAVAIEAQESLGEFVDLNAAYQADIEQGTLTIAGRPLRVVLIGTVSKNSNTWLWSWANDGFNPAMPAIQPARRTAEVAQGWGLWELGEPGFGLDGVLDTGLGAGASIALVAAPIIGATAFYGADYGAGVAYFGIVDPGVQRPRADAVTFPRRIMTATEVVPGSARAQVLTYANVHNLRVVAAGDNLEVHLPPGDVMTVEFDSQGRITRISGSIAARGGQ